MRRILITLTLFIVFAVAGLAVWIFAGRELSLFIDRFWTVEIDSTKIQSIAYEGSGTGGWFAIGGVHLSLDDKGPNVSPSVGSTKDNQVAVASGGKVFPLGPPMSTGPNGGEFLGAAPPSGDQAFLVTRHSAVSWPTPLEFNFMTGHAPSWRRHMYYELQWRKPSGATLDMLWRYEQPFYGKQLIPGDGWGSGFGVREGSTGLVRVEIRQ